MWELADKRAPGPHQENKNSKACSNWFQKSWHAVQWRGTLTFKKYFAAFQANLRGRFSSWLTPLAWDQAGVAPLASLSACFALRSVALFTALMLFHAKDRAMRPPLMVGPVVETPSSGSSDNQQSRSAESPSWQTWRRHSLPARNGLAGVPALHDA